VNNLKNISNKIPTKLNTATKVYGSLDCWDYGGFVPVTDKGIVYYGGHQGWLMNEEISKFWADRSCGVTSAANTLYYMAKNTEGKSNLYPYSTITRLDFSKFQRELYDCISPSICGIPFVEAMISRIEKYAKKKDVQLKANLMNLKWNDISVGNYILQGLNKNRPVMLLTWNSKTPSLTMHWVTVTRIYEDDTTKIVTSNWGGKREYDLSYWINDSSVYKGVIYFD